jgi:hypothetical protein
MTTHATADALLQSVVLMVPKVAICRTSIQAAYYLNVTTPMGLNNYGLAT